MTWAQMMDVVKLFFYLPFHAMQTYLAWWSPRWLFVKVYAPSSEREREQELRVRNKLRLVGYHAKKTLL